MSALASPLFEIELGTEKFRLAPKSVDELAAWLEKEYGAWEKVHAAGPNPNQDVSFLGNVNGTLKNLARARNTANAAKTQAETDRAQSVVNTRNHVQDVYNSSRLPLSESVKARLIRDLAEQDAYSAKVALYISGVGAPVNSDISLVNPATVRGLVYGALTFRSLEAPLTDSAVRHLIEKGEKGVAEWSAKHDKAEERLNATHRNVELALEQFKGDAAAAQETAGTFLVELRNAFAKELKEAKDELGRFREVTTKDIALKAPSEYWRGKARSHRFNSYALFAGVVALMVTFGFAVVKLLPLLLPQAGTQAPTYGFIAAVAIVSTLAFWSLRIVVRLFFSQIHLAQDAQERVTMVTTYLALVETGTFQPGDLEVVLGALFRRAIDGLVKDEGMPASPIELITRNR